jgi:transposase-like protein
VEVLGRYANKDRTLSVLEQLLTVENQRSMTTSPPRKRVKRLRPARIDELVDAYEAGATLTELAQDHGIHEDTVARLLRSRGVRLRYRRLDDPADVERAKVLYESGMSLAAVGRELGVDATTVQRAFKKAGVARRPASMPRRERRRPAVGS